MVYLKLIWRVNFVLRWFTNTHKENYCYTWPSSLNAWKVPATPLRYCDQRGTYPYPHWLMATEQHCWGTFCRLSSLATLYGVLLCPTEPGTRVFTLAQLPKSFNTLCATAGDLVMALFCQSPDDLERPVQWSLCSSPGGAMVRASKGPALPWWHIVLGFFATTQTLLACDSLFNHSSWRHVPREIRVFDSWHIFLFQPAFSSLTSAECVTT